MCIFRALSTAEKALAAAELPDRKKQQQLLSESTVLAKMGGGPRDQEDVRVIRGWIEELKKQMSDNTKKNQVTTGPRQAGYELAHIAFRRGLDWAMFLFPQNSQVPTISALECAMATTYIVVDILAGIKMADSDDLLPLIHQGMEERIKELLLKEWELPGRDVDQFFPMLNQRLTEYDLSRKEECGPNELWPLHKAMLKNIFQEPIEDITVMFEFANNLYMPTAMVFYDLFQKIKISQKQTEWVDGD